MSSFFSIDSPLFCFLSKVADLMILNIIFIISCIPIFTIGAAWTALSYVNLKIARGEESYIVRSYIKSFKQNFRQATLMWIPTFILYLLFYIDFKIIGTMDGAVKTVMEISLLAIVILTNLMVFVMFPVLAQFENTTKNIIKNSLFMTIFDFPKVLAVFAITIGSILLTLLNNFTFTWGILFWLLMGFGVIGFCTAKFFVQIFDRYIVTDEDDGEEQGEVEIDSSVFTNLQPVNLPDEEEEQ